MDQRYTQWQTYRPVRRVGQPWNEEASKNGYVRPLPQTNPNKPNQQQPRRGGCCGKRATD